MSKKVYTLLFDGYADWEIGYTLAALRSYGKVEVATVGFSDKVVTSMGGLRVIPDTVISQVNLQDVLIFILPGGNLWETEYPVVEIEQFLHSLEIIKIPIASICAATTVVARAGLLHGRKHTSNSKKYISKMVPEYSEEANYVDSLSTRDQHIITASGLGSIEFAVEIFNELDLLAPEMRTMWFEAFKHGNYPEDI